MALPPTLLTTLLYSAPTPDAMYDALHSANCLSKRALSSRHDVVALMTGVNTESDARYAAQPGLVGPTSVDQIARALASSPYLNSRGLRMHGGHTNSDDATNKSWWQFWS